MKSNDDNVISFDDYRKAEQKKRIDETNRKLEAAPGIAQTLMELRTKLPRGDRSIFAQNLGDMCEHVFGSSTRAMRNGLKHVFEEEFGPSWWNFWKKRKRFVRLPGEESETPGGADSYGQYHAGAQEYCRLAKALGRVGVALNDEQAVLRLVRGSTFDTTEVTSRRARSSQAEKIIPTMRSVLRKLRPELTRLQEAVLERDAHLAELHTETSGLSDFDFAGRHPRPVVDLGEITQKIPPFLAIPLGTLDEAWSLLAQMLECRKTLQRHHHYARLHFSQFTGETDFSKVDWNTELFLDCAKERIFLELAASCLKIEDVDAPDDALVANIIEKVGRERIWLSDHIQQARPELIKAGEIERAELDTNHIFWSLVEEYGSPQAAVECLSTRMENNTARIGPESHTQQSFEAAIEELVQKAFVEREEFRKHHLEAIEIELAQQPCSISFTHNLVISPAIDRSTGDWTFCLGVPVFEKLDFRLAIPDFTPLLEKSTGWLSSMTANELEGFFLLLNCCTLVSVEIDGAASRRAAMGLSYGEEGQLYLAFYALDGLAEGDPDYLPPHLTEPWSGMPRGILPVFDTEKGLDLLFADKKNVKFGRYESLLNGKRSPLQPAAGLNPNSIAADIREDLAIGDREDGSRIFDQLKTSICEKIDEVEQETNNAVADYKKRMEWLHEE